MRCGWQAWGGRPFYCGSVVLIGQYHAIIAEVWFEEMAGNSWIASLAMHDTREVLGLFSGRAAAMHRVEQRLAEIGI